MMKRILLIDDDAELCELLREYFEAEGFLLECAHSGDDGLGMLSGVGADLVILDVMLPGRDGFDVLRDIRAQSSLPVLMLSARGDHIDRVVGLEIGADDYICKPFSTRELAARVRAVLRRFEGTASVADDTIRVADLEMSPLSRSVRVGGRGVPLTNVEFRLLECLLNSAGKIVRLSSLSVGVLRRQYSTNDRSLSVHMSNLRKKIGPYPSGDERIATVRGEGFIYVFPKIRPDGGGDVAV